MAFVFFFSVIDGPKSSSQQMWSIVFRHIIEKLHGIKILFIIPILERSSSKIIDIILEYPIVLAAIKLVNRSLKRFDISHLGGVKRNVLVHSRIFLFFITSSA